MDFLYKKLSASGFGISSWLQVKEFVSIIRKMIDNGETISNTTVWPIMISILEKYPNDQDIDGVSQGVLYNTYKDVRRGSYLEDQKYVGEFGKLYNQIMALRSDKDYVPNPPQMDKFLDLVQFFLNKKRESSEATVDPNGFSPRECHGGVTATFIVFDVSGDEVKEFSKVLKNCTAVSIDAVGDSMVEISCTVPNVFVHKSELK